MRRYLIAVVVALTPLLALPLHVQASSTQTDVTFTVNGYNVTGTTVVGVAASSIQSIAYTITTAPNTTIANIQEPSETFSQSVSTQTSTNMATGYVRYTAHVTLTSGSSSVTVTCTTPVDQQSSSGSTGADVITPSSAYMRGA